MLTHTGSTRLFGSLLSGFFSLDPAQGTKPGAWYHPRHFTLRKGHGITQGIFTKQGAWKHPALAQSKVAWPCHILVLRLLDDVLGLLDLHPLVWNLLGLHSWVCHLLGLVLRLLDVLDEPRLLGLQSLVCYLLDLALLPQQLGLCWGLRFLGPAAMFPLDGCLLWLLWLAGFDAWLLPGCFGWLGLMHGSCPKIIVA